MTMTTRPPAVPRVPSNRPEEQRIILHAIPWNTYTTIGDALDHHREVRLIYDGGTLTFVVKSREHEVLAERFGYLVGMVAAGLSRECESCGQMTLRRKDLDAGVEGDKTFYVGPNAVRMRGVKNVTLETDPPPDLAIEVEVSHSADEAIATYARLGVPEVWRFDAAQSSVTFLRLADDGRYVAAPRSSAFPELLPEHVTEQLKAAAELGQTTWLVGLLDWARATLH